MKNLLPSMLYDFNEDILLFIILSGRTVKGQISKCFLVLSDGRLMLSGNILAPLEIKPSNYSKYPFPRYVCSDFNPCTVLVGDIANIHPHIGSVVG